MASSCAACDARHVFSCAVLLPAPFGASDGESPVTPPRVETGRPIRWAAPQAGRAAAPPGQPMLDDKQRQHLEYITITNLETLTFRSE